MRTNVLFLTAAGFALILCAGCASDEPTTTRELTVADFCGGGQRRVAAGNGASVTGGEDDHTAMATNTHTGSGEPDGHAQPVSSDQVDTGGSTIPPDAVFTTDAMVGEVNGKSIYAGEVLASLHDKFEVWGRRMRRDEFRRQAGAEIERKLWGIVRDRALVAEAERELNDAMQKRLDAIVNDHRAELLRRFGEGSATRADAEIRRRTGKSLEQMLVEYRNGQLIAFFIRQRVQPHIHVTREMVRREYERRHDEFNPPTERTVRFICARSKRDAMLIEDALRNGSFVDVAHQPENAYKASEGGLWSGTVKGDVLFGSKENPDPRDEAMTRLGPGEHSEKIMVGVQYWWVYVESVTQPPRQPLTSDVQVKLRGELYTKQYRERQRKVQMEAVERANFTPVPEMLSEIERVALSRYAKQP